MPVERRERIIAIGIGSTGNGRNPTINGRRQPSCGDTSRMNREVHVRSCDGLGVEFPGLLGHLCRLARCTKIVSYLRYYGHAGPTAAIAVFDPYASAPGKLAKNRR